MYFYLETPDKNGNVLKKCIYKYEPYFYIIVQDGYLEDYHQFLSKQYEGKISSSEIVEKVDLDLPNHLSGLRKKLIKVNFKNVQNLVSVRNSLRPIIQKKKAKKKVLNILDFKDTEDLQDKIEDIREDDVLYHSRVCIDKEIRCGLWYKIKYNRDTGCIIEHLQDKLSKNPLTVLAFDIETTKLPLKFPDARIDSIMLISYMIDGDGYLITNRSIISEEIEDFQYSPKPEFEGNFHIFNEKDEESLLKRFVLHCKETRPNIFVTFNGDYFDIPFIGARLKVYGMSLEKDLGLQNITLSNKPGEGEYMGRYSIHIDCLYWVKRDAFLPQGSHGLKAVTKAKLGYNPIEVDPEKMVQNARETPKQFCAYSVSDALATYYLYKLMIHDFIFALCTIIPLAPDDVLRKGSGTLCENLLMAQAYRRNIIFPQKQVSEFEKFFEGHLIDNETYSGGHVECLNVGIYRVDIPTEFKFDCKAYEELINSTEDYIKFSLEIENKGKYSKDDIENYDEVVNDIKDKLNALYEISNKNLNVSLNPLIYHLDVGAMYPNIILTNKLQPVAIATEEICSKCLYNNIDECKRHMKWAWRGELFPLTRSEYENLKYQFDFELMNNEEMEIGDINEDEYKKNIIKRVKTYCSKVYKQIHIKKLKEKEGVVCMRENSFYVDTVRDFRDRRYEFKYKVKEWKIKNEEAHNKNDQEEILHTKNMIDLYDSLQLAHKIILNSFYGYVMRKGSRWFSMEMAAMVTYLGSHLITEAREFIEKIGKPLELDTDGIWCCLPKGFPEFYKFRLKNGKKINFAFPQSMLNKRTYDKYSNPVYNEKDVNDNWIIRREMSVFFEIDGPYKCMVLPAAKEEGKMLKKRYIVIDFDDKIQELKGFELKRRGELKIIKIFQEEVFGQFLKGNNLRECYLECAEIARRWYSILELNGEGINDEELLDYIEESRMMSKSIDEYGSQKSTSITCAKRLSEILGSELLREKGLCSKFIISKKPLEAPIAERAIPTVVFQSPLNVKKKLLRKWLKDYSIDDIDMRDVIDWDYYKERLAGNILKIIIIPAAMQKVDNPFPNIKYPEWVNRLMSRKKNEQKSLNNFFTHLDYVDKMILVEKDLEKLNLDLDNENNKKKGKKEDSAKKKKNNANNIEKYMSKNVIQYENNNNMFLEVEEEKNEDIINVNDDFNGWLKQQKKKWKKLKNKNNKKPNISNLRMTQLNINIENAFRKELIYIIQVKENPKNLGLLNLWVVFGNIMTKINLKIKRKIYINSMKQNVSDVFKPVKLILPRNKPILNLYEFDFEEKDFITTFNNFNDYLVTPSIEGVYQTKIPLVYEVIKNLGSIIKFNNKRKINLPIEQFEFNMDDFEVKNPEIPLRKNDNLEIETKNNIYLNKIYLYHSNCGLRHIFVLLKFQEKIAKFYIVNPVSIKIEVPNISKLIDNMYKDIQEENSEIDFPQFDFTVESYVRQDLKLTLKEINLLLSEIRYNTKNQNLNNKNIPNILIQQTFYSQEKLFDLGLTLISEFPIIIYPYNKEDNNYPALDWIKFTIKKLTEHYIDLYPIYNSREKIGYYCNIPISNIENDMAIYCIDVIFGRMLTMSKQILWYSHSGFPDLGGGDINHDFYGQIDKEFSKIINKGLYLGYVQEIDIGLFCANSIIESDNLRDIGGRYELQYVEREKKKNIGVTHTNEENLKKIDRYKMERDEFVLGANAFIVLKKMVEKWLNDIGEISLEYAQTADYLLIHFYRWISSFNSKFYDPVIYRMINLLMEKYFNLLIQKIINFGFKIVYADNKKILIYNDKSNYEDFDKSIDLLINSIRRTPIFTQICLEKNKSWKMLLFRDMYNYAGIPSFEEDENNLSQIPKLETKWTLSEYLPKILEKDFLSIISDYLIKLYKFFYLCDAEMLSNLKSFYGNIYLSVEEANKILEIIKLYKMTSKEPDKVIETINEFKSFLIRDYISSKMFNILPNIMLKRKDYEDEDLFENEINEDIDNDNNNNNQVPIFTRDDFRSDYYSSDEDMIDQGFNDEIDEKDKLVDTRNYKQVINKNLNLKKKSKSISIWEYPIKLGSNNYIEKPNLAIEYINYVCEVLSLDKNILSNVIVLKSNCLKLIQAEEYSKETYFKEPCKTFIVHNIICEVCSNNFDLDLCRDNNILSFNWNCEKCNYPFDKKMIEYLIIKKVQNMIDYYFNQDIECEKCKNQKNEPLFSYCHCGGNYKKTFEEEFFTSDSNFNSIQEALYLLKEISNYYRFDILKSLIESFLQ